MPRFLQMLLLRVLFKRIEHAGVEIVFHLKEEEFTFWPSYIYGWAFARLTKSLTVLIDEQGTQIVLWCDAPREYEMRFSRRDEVVTLEMWHFESWDRSPKERPYCYFSFSGTYDEVCLPFWRALRDLQKLYTEKEFEARWRFPFPARELALLTQKLDKVR